jgi:hypothetical protein
MAIDTPIARSERKLDVERVTEINRRRRSGPDLPPERSMSFDEETDVSALLKILVKLPTATPTVDELAEAYGMDLDAFNDALSQADVLGLVQAWEGDTLAVILSSFGAEQLGVRLEEIEGKVGEALFRWVPLDAPIPEEPKASNRRAMPASVLAGDEDDFDYLDSLADPKALEPIELVGRLEQLEGKLPATAKEFVKQQAIVYRPNFHLLGLRQRWDGPGREHEGPCIGCLSRSLLPTEYCCCCDRSGVDFLLPPLPKNLLKAMRQQPYDLAGGSGEAKPPKPKKPPGVPVAKGKRGRPKGSKSKSKQGRASA